MEPANLIVILMIGAPAFWVLVDSAKRYGRPSWILAALVPFTLWGTAVIYLLIRLTKKPTAKNGEVKPLLPWHYAAVGVPLLLVSAAGIMGNKTDSSSTQQASVASPSSQPTPKPKPTRKPTAKELAARAAAEKKAAAEQKKREAQAAMEAANAQVKALNSNIIGTEVADNGRKLRILHFKETVWSGDTWVFECADDTMHIMKALSQEIPNDYDKVSLELFAPTTDKYGNSGKSTAMRWTFDMSEVRKINWENFTNWDMLGFAEAEFTPIGRQAVIVYCSKENNLKYSRSFCEQLF